MVTTILPGGGQEVVSQQIPNSFSGQFFGFISTGAIASVQLTSGTQGQGAVAETFDLDDLTFGGTAVQAVPEPSTTISAAAGVLMCLGYGWRRRKAKLAA